MTGRETDQAEDRLLLRSRLSEIAQVPAWIDNLASRHSIPENVKFAINLCLEEAVSNVIRHGYGEAKDGSVRVFFSSPRENWLVFTVEDEAHHFNPLESAPAPSGIVRVGGKGIHFLRQFADQLEYEVTPSGNRLKISFTTAA